MTFEKLCHAHRAIAKPSFTLQVQEPHLTQPVFRFAPSPHGWLHLGHARSALTGFECAHAVGGRFLVRLEDRDALRCKPEFIDQIFADLDWLGIAWETPVLRQSEHLDVYRQAAARLTAMGLTYPCFASRTEIAAAAEPGRFDPDGAPFYPGLHRQLDVNEIARRIQQGEPHALRLDMAKAIARAATKTGDAALGFTELDDTGAPRFVAADPSRWDDIVLMRKDGSASYHLAVVVDDARQGITHVTRGMDLYASTDVHRLLQALLGLPVPIYQHHSLVLGADGAKLSKSFGAPSLKSMKSQGFTATDIRRLAGFH